MDAPTFKKRVAGKEADLAGRAFEQMFQHMCRRTDIACTRIPDGCKQVRIKGRLQLVRTRSPFDWMISAKLGQNPVVVLLDTKTTAGSTFPHSKINHDQVAELHKHAANGILAGYVIEFREANAVYFFPTLVLKACTGPGSIKPEGILLGSSAAFDVRKIFTPSHFAVDPHNPGRRIT